MLFSIFADGVQSNNITRLSAVPNHPCKDSPKPLFKPSAYFWASRKKGASLSGTIVWVILRTLEVPLQYQLLCSASSLLSQLGLTPIASSSSDTKINLGLTPYHVLVLLLAAGSSAKKNLLETPHRRHRNARLHVRHHRNLQLPSQHSKHPLRHIPKPPNSPSLCAHRSTPLHHRPINRMALRTPTQKLQIPPSEPRQAVFRRALRAGAERELRRVRDMAERVCSRLRWMGVGGRHRELVDVGLCEEGGAEYGCLLREEGESNSFFLFPRWCC